MHWVLEESPQVHIQRMSRLGSRDFCRRLGTLLQSEDVLRRRQCRMLRFESVESDKVELNPFTRANVYCNLSQTQSSRLSKFAPLGNGSCQILHSLASPEKKEALRHVIKEIRPELTDTNIVDTTNLTLRSSFKSRTHQDTLDEEANRLQT
jgi:hypothetical protein